MRFTERFRGYDAAEVDTFLSEAAEALEELVAEHSAPLAALAAERARQAIEQVRHESLAAVDELQGRRAELERAIADLQLMLQDRRRGVAEELALIGAMFEQAPKPAALEGPDSEAEEEPTEALAGEALPAQDSFLARLERAATDGGEADSV